MINQLKIILLLFTGLLTTQCQNMKINKNIDITKALIKVDSCGLYYNNQRLDLGTPYKDWEKVLGKPNRITDIGRVWDNLGISVDDWQNDKGFIAAIYIHFLNLNSSEGKAGELNFAGNWKPFDESNWEKDYLKENGERLKEEANPKHQVYPFTLYSGYVNLHGFPVGAGMKVAEINSYRKDLPFSGEFYYIDDDIDGVNDSGNTIDTFGGDYRAGGTECLNKRLQYYELTYTASGALEYLKIGYEDKSNYENRMIMLEDKQKQLKK